MSKEMTQNVKSVFIEEEGKYDLHSDHFIISTDLELYLSIVIIQKGNQ